MGYSILLDRAKGGKFALVPNTNGCVGRIAPSMELRLGYINYQSIGDCPLNHDLKSCLKSTKVGRVHCHIISQRMKSGGGITSYGMF